MPPGGGILFSTPNNAFLEGQITRSYSKFVVILMISSHKKNISQLGSFPQVGVKISRSLDFLHVGSELHTWNHPFSIEKVLGCWHVLMFFRVRIQSMLWQKKNVSFTLNSQKLTSKFYVTKKKNDISEAFW